MGSMKMNNSGMGPEGTNHKSPAQSAGRGIEFKWRSRPDGTVHQVSRHSCE